MSRPSISKRRIGACVVALGLAVLVAACGGGDDSSGAPDQTTTSAGPSDAAGNGGTASGTADGFVRVDGTTFEFSFNPAGRCGVVAQDDSIYAEGYQTDDPTRQVIFHYALAEESGDGADWLQIIVYDGEGQQLWYSKVGFGGGTDVGSIGSLERNGNTVTASGRLGSGSDNTVLADFTAEMTCE